MNIYDLSATHSRIRVDGAHRLDFLHRMSTGDVARLKPGESRATVFTTPIGRMVDYAFVIALEDSALIVGAAGNQARLTGWLRKYILFNDDVSLADASSELGVYGALGEYPPSEWGHAIGLPAVFGRGALVLARSALPGQRVLPAEAFEPIRVSAGHPAWPSEISTDYIPLEAGLWGAVSFTKGCYIGQEIIARMESRGKVAKRLMRLRRLPSTEDIGRGAEVRLDGAACGLVTSAAQAMGGADAADALAYIRIDAASVGREVELAMGELRGRARVVAAGGDGTVLV